MKLRALIAAFGCSLAAAIPVAAASVPANIAASPGAAFPERSYVVTLPTHGTLAASQVKVTEDGKPVLGLSVGHTSSAGRTVIDYRSIANPGTAVSVRVSIAGVAVLAAHYRAPALALTPAPVYRPSLIERFIQAPLTMALVVIAVALAIGGAVAIIATQRTGSLRARVGRFVSVSENPARRARGQITQQVRGRLERGTNGLQGLNAWQRLQASLELADIKLSAGVVVALTLAATILVAVLLNALVGPLGVLLSLGTPFVTRGAIRAKLAHKQRRFAEQLPDCLDVLASSLRAGHALVSAFGVVVENASEPAKSEFQRVISEEQLGVPLEDALQVAVVRMQNRDLDQVALVARLQREMGSNSAEVLDQVAENVRGRVELRRQVQTLTAQGRLSRWILTALPIALACALSALDPGYLNPLFHHNGRLLLVAAALMVIAGSLVIRKVVDIKA